MNWMLFREDAIPAANQAHGNFTECVNLFAEMLLPPLLLQRGLRFLSAGASKRVRAHVWLCPKETAITPAQVKAGRRRPLYHQSDMGRNSAPGGFLQPCVAQSVMWCDVICTFTRAVFLAVRHNKQGLNWRKNEFDLDSYIGCKDEERCSHCSFFDGQKLRPFFTATPAA